MIADGLTKVLPPKGISKLQALPDELLLILFLLLVTVGEHAHSHSFILFVSEDWQLAVPVRSIPLHIYLLKSIDLRLTLL